MKIKNTFSADESKIYDLALDLSRNEFAMHVDSEKVSKKDLEDYLRDKIKNDISRQALPLATVSEEIVAGRYSDWKHFISLRYSSEAHYEIREVASQINEYMD